MEADLARYYGRDLADYLAGELTARKLLVLINQLPHDAATIRAAGRDAADWSREAALLAGIFQALTGKPHPEQEAVVKASEGDRAAERLLAQRKRLQGG